MEKIKGNYEMRLSQYKHLLREVNPHKLNRIRKLETILGARSNYTYSFFP